MTGTALIVDDSVTIRSMVGIAFKKMGWESITANHAEEALDKIKSGRFDFLVVDINMPGMNGIELIREIRKNPIYKNAPILVLTTEAGEKIKEEGKSAGANGWMVKPMKPEVLEAAVKKLCK